MPPGWNQVRALLLAAAFTPAELESLCQAVFGTALNGITTATDASEQADAIVAFAIQYGLVRELADIVLWQSARRPAVQNLLLSDDMSIPTDGQQGLQNQPNPMDIIRLENRVERLSDKVDVLAHKVDMLLQRAPLNWNIVGWGIVVAVAAGTLSWALSLVN